MTVFILQGSYPGLPDVSRYNIPNGKKMYQMKKKYTKGYTIYQMAAK
jgi:hypothetical protein